VRGFWLIIVLMLSARLLTSALADMPTRVNPQAVKRELKQILSAPEYNRTYEVTKTPEWMKKLERIWERVKLAIGNVLDWLIRRIASITGLEKEGIGKTISIILACAVIVGFLILVALILRKVLGRIPAQQAMDDDYLDQTYQLLSAGPLIKEAQKLAQAGDYRGAFRCAYLASISHLDDNKALRFERSRTNWEYLRELRSGGHDAPYDALRPLTMDFDRKFYGGEVCTHADYERAARVYERISSGVGA
jgi:hypothetical protein